MECPFCKIAKKEIESVILYEDNFFISVLDIFPNIPGQIIVFPKRHVKYLWELEDSEIARIFTFIKIISKSLKEELNVDGISIYIPQDTIAGQRFDHLIIYVFPRKKDDKFYINWERKQIEIKELEEIKNKISKRIKNILEKSKEENINFIEMYRWYIKKP